MKQVLLLGGPKCGQVVHTDRTQGFLRYNEGGGTHVYRVEKIVEPSDIVFVGVYSDTALTEAMDLYKEHQRWKGG